MNNTRYNERYNDGITRAVGVEWNAYQEGADTLKSKPPSLPPLESGNGEIANAAGWLDVLPPQADCLRDYQAEQVGHVAEAMRQGFRRILVQGATGSGKTHVIATIVLAAFMAGLRVLILATRTRLVKQLHERLNAFDTPHGVIANPLPELRNYSALVQIASVDTLHRRAVVNEHIPLPAADVVIFDEAQLATADTRLGILDSYPEAVRIGFTATPARKSGRSLAAAFNVLILGRSIRELTAAGVLVPLRIFNTPVVTTKELRSVPKDNDGDYQPAALGDLLSRPKLVGDVLENWLRIAKGKRTLVFAVNKTHGAALLADFLRQGIRAEMLTDQDEEATREEVIARLERGETHIVVNCFLLSYGADIPAVECIVLARPTRSLTMFLQMVGRGLRPSPETGKHTCILIDHGRCCEYLGLPQSDFGWNLDDTRNASREASERAKSAAETMRTCPECTAIWLTSEQGNACPECGWKPLPKSKPIAAQDADLEEMADVEDQPTSNDQRVTCFYREACGYFARRNPDKWMEKPKSVRWRAWCETRAKFRFAETEKKPGHYWDLSPFGPSVEVSGWLQHRIIKFARSRAKAAA
jgi:DNA repair protein RadD